MPAVQLSRLKVQMQELAWYFDEPAEFRRELNRLFDLYSDRTYRVGQAVPAAPVVLMYHTPPLVLRQLDLFFEDACLARPDSALSLADTLWQDPYMEPRQFGAVLVGNLPETHAAAALTRLETWCQPGEEKMLVNTLLNQGSKRLRQRAAAEYIGLAKKWADSEVSYQSFALRAVLPLISDSRFENLPVVFNLVGPLLTEHPAPLQYDLQEALQALAKRIPTETGYFLRQVVSLTNDPVVMRLARRCLPSLSPEAQRSLRPLLSNRPR